MDVKNNRKYTLAVTPNENVYTSKKAEMLKNGETVSQKGKKSYVQKAIETGVYKQIGYDIKEYREQNEDCSCLQLYTDVLHKKYPHIFYLSPEKVYNAQNILKVINADKFWCSCYFFNKRKLMHQVELQLSELLDQEDLEDSTILSAYDKINKYKIEKAKLRLEEQKMELIKQSTVSIKKDASSIETNKTLNEIADALNSLGGEHSE